MNTLTPFSQRTPDEIYLEYLNDWLTIDAMADYYGIEPERLGQIIASVRYAETI
jgi:hypothetical protein